MEQPEPDLKEAWQGLYAIVVRVGNVLELAGLNPWILDDVVWKWFKNLERVFLESCLEMQNLMREIKALKDEEAVRKDLYSIPCLRCCIKREIKSKKDSILLRLKEMRERLESCFKDDDVVKFEEVLNESRKPVVTTCELRVSQVRGQTFEKDCLLKYFFNSPDANELLKDREGKVLVINIQGPEGSGKTTLAQMVYNDKSVGEYYQVRNWVYVGHNFTDDIINRVRRDLDLTDVESDNFGMPYLLVFDDVPHWDSISPVFELLSIGAPGSVILLISRRSIDNVDHEHIVRPLSTSDCWSILKRMALSGKPRLLEQVRNIGNKFAEECGGLPLGANIVGDYLKSKETAREWEDAFGDEMWQTRIIRKLSELRYPDVFREYYYLSTETIRCFSYCTVFPKDTQIDVERLVALWAAMGYIGDHAIVKEQEAIEDTSMEMRGYNLVVSLETSSMFTQVKRCIHKNKITSCMINGKYHVVAQHHEDMMYLQIKNSGRSLVNLSHGKLPEFKELKNVKALVLSSCKLEYLSDEVASLTNLQFLDLSGNPLKRLPETIGSLKGLKSLYLQSCYLLLSLPQRIGYLRCLRHLRINHTTDQLHNLPDGFKKLTSIKTLDTFRVGGTYENIGKLKELNHLVNIRISVHGEVRFIDADLKSKSELENLELSFVGKGRDQDMEGCFENMEPPENLEMLLIEDYHGLRLPTWILVESFINKLKRLSLRSAVNISSLPALGTLSSLEFLWLYDMPKISRLDCKFFGLPRNDKIKSKDPKEVYDATDSEITEEGHDGLAARFSRLKTLRIEYLENLKIWEDADEHYEKQIKVMPSLEELIISGCPKLQEIPLRILRSTPWFNHITSREKATWIDDYCSKSSCQKEVILALKASYNKLKNFVHDAYMTRAPAQSLKMSIPEGVLGKERVTSYLTIDSLHDWFEKDCSIFAEQMCVWSRFIYELMTPDDKERVQMASSALITTAGRQRHSEMRAEDLVDFMMDNKAKLYLVPFFRLGHWELLAIVPENDVIYWFDSLQGNISSELTEFLNMVKKKYVTRNLNSTIAHDSWKVVNIKHKKQVDNWEGGYYVMIWMQKIALEIQDLDLESHFPTDTSSYEPDKIREVDWKWCAHVVPEIPA